MVSLRKNSQLNEDQSIDVLRNRLVSQQPFIFIRYGDGALECMSGKTGRTCDGEFYSEELGRELRRVWELLFTHSNVFIGDWFSASFSSESPHGLYQQEYENLIRESKLVGYYEPTWLHFETLLLMRESDKLVEFYNTVRKDTRKKLLMGPKEWRPAAEVLKSEFMEIPVSTNLFKTHCYRIKSFLKYDCKFDVLLYGAGMAGNIPVIDLWHNHPEYTIINLGSALDPVYRGRTRRQQISLEQARALFQRIIS